MAADSPAFLGTGWAFPPAFDRQRVTVNLSSAETNIKQCLQVLMSTSIGERLMLAGYGTDLSTRVFDTLTTTMANDLRSNLKLAILRWEPRIDVNAIDLSELSPLQGRLTITIDFTVRQTNSRNNLVFPFYLNEATLPLPAP
jgi:phage baseplate assembly protein W